MESCVDFFTRPNNDTLRMKILMCLEDPSDLVRVSSLSRCWRHFVIANGLCKKLCLRMFPCLHNVCHVAEPNSSLETSSEIGRTKAMESEILRKEHRFYAFLARGGTSFALQECISDAITASSTDNYPEESIHNTLEPKDRVGWRASYWSSKGHSYPAVPETLTYKLLADICVVTEISVQPFEAYFQSGKPIYSAKSVRFRMGHLRPPECGLMGEASGDCTADKFIWTYTSPEFAMAQENRLQNFKLPEPVLCIGGILQVELLGRVQKQDMDGLYYICVSHVEVVGRLLSPVFSVDIVEPSGKFMLKAESYKQPSELENVQESRVRDLRDLVRGKGGVVEYDWREDDDEDVFPE